MGLGWTLIGLAVAYESTIGVKETMERHDYFRLAQNYCKEVGKPLLVVGMKRHFWEPENGDITIDIDPSVLQIKGGVLADERSIPFDDKDFGAIYNAHTLEHMATAEDVQRAVDECTRVAEKAFFLCPSPYSIYSSLFCPSHHLRIWLDQENNEIRVTDNNFNTGLGIPRGGQYEAPRSVGQALVTIGRPRVKKIGVGYILER